MEGKDRTGKDIKAESSEVKDHTADRTREVAKEVAKAKEAMYSPTKCSRGRVIYARHQDTQESTARNKEGDIRANVTIVGLEDTPNHCAQKGKARD